MDQSHCAIIIQARMSSLRLPGKMLALLNGTPLVKYVYERAKQTGIPVVVATSDDASDEELAAYCESNTIPVIRGSLPDVLGRYIFAAEQLGVQYVVRVCGDTPFVDVGLIQKMCSELQRGEWDYVGCNRETVASAFYSETATLGALKRAASLSIDAQDHEHVTKFVLARQDQFKVKLIDSEFTPQSIKGLRLTIDYPEDIHNANRVAQALGNRFDFSSEDVIRAVHKLF